MIGKLALAVALFTVTLGVGVAQAHFLSMEEGKRQARIFANRVAKQAGDDSHSVSDCSRRNHHEIRCLAFFYRERGVAQIECFATIQVRLHGSNLLRGYLHKPRCETH
jgi:hypothetical protein